MQRTVLYIALLALSACTPEPEGSTAPAAVVPVVSGNVAAGRDESVQCVSCHGALGDSDNDRWPDLAGQSAAYLVKQLKDFRDGRRYDPWMNPMAEGLTDRDIDNLAAFYTGNDGIEGAAASAPAEAATCIACHSAQARQANPLWPSLAGQNQPYLVKQMRDYRDGRRTDPVMAPLVTALSDDEIERIATHFANL